MEAIIGALGIVASIALFFAGVRHGRRQEEERRKHELQLAREQREHELALENIRYRRELVSKVADEYVSMSRRRYDSGPHALARLGLEQLGSDEEIRVAIEEMRIRAGEDPWAGHGAHVEDIDLVEFFRAVRMGNIDFFQTPVGALAEQMRAKGHLRNHPGRSSRA